MKEIRAKVVEAMAQAYWEKYYLEPPWAEISGPQRQVILDAIEAALDAALDVLGDAGDNLPYLLSVLRAGKGSDE